MAVVESILNHLLSASNVWIGVKMHDERTDQSDSVDASITTENWGLIIKQRFEFVKNNGHLKHDSEKAFNHEFAKHNWIMIFHKVEVCITVNVVS